MLVHVQAIALSVYIAYYTFTNSDFYYTVCHTLDQMPSILYIDELIMNVQVVKGISVNFLIGHYIYNNMSTHYIMK